MVIWGNIWTWFQLVKPMKWGSYEVPIMHLPVCLYIFLGFFLWNDLLNFLSSWMKWKYSKKWQLDFGGKSFVLSKCNQNEMGIFVVVVSFKWFFLKNLVLKFTGPKGAKNAPKMTFFRFYEKLKFGVFLFFLCVKLQ